MTNPKTNPYRSASAEDAATVETDTLTRMIAWTSEHAWPLLLGAYAAASVLAWVVLVVGYFTSGIGHVHWAPVVTNLLPVVGSSVVALGAAAEPADSWAPSAATIAVLAWAFGLAMVVASTIVQVFA